MTAVNSRLYKIRFSWFYTLLFGEEKSFGILKVGGKTEKKVRGNEQNEKGPRQKKKNLPSPTLLIV